MSSTSSFGNVAIIPSLALFRGVTAAALPPVIFLQGTVNPNDGGQGFYSVNLTDKTTPDNGTSVIVDGGGFRWELVTADTASQIVASLSFGGTLPAIDPILGGIATVAAAATTDLATVTQASALITGAGAAITSLGTLAAGRMRWVRFDGANTLTHNATSLILPGGANITTAAGDAACFLSLGSGNWQCLYYTEAAGGTVGTLPISQGGTGQITSVAAFDALQAQGANIASVAGITDIAAATGPTINITGTNAITGLGTAAAGVRRTVKFTGAASLVYNATALILPNATNIQCAANDTAEFMSLGSGNWICLWYKRQTAPTAFRAALAADQTGIAAATSTKVTFGSEAFDVGGAYDNTTYRWTPLAGIVLVGVSVALSGVTVGGAAIVQIYKNGSPLLNQRTAGDAAGAAWIDVSVLDQANGTDYYEAFVYAASGGTVTVSSVSNYSSFWGRASG